MSYGNWLSGIVDNAKKKTKEAIEGVKTTAQNAVGTVVNNAQNAVRNVTSGYADWLNGTSNSVQQSVSQGASALTGAVGQATGQIGQSMDQTKQAIGNQVNGAIQQGTAAVNTAVGNVSQQITDNVNDANQKVQGAVGNQPVTTPVQNEPTQTTPSVESTTHITTPSGTHVDTYEEFLAKNAEDLQYIRDETTKHYDEQNKLELEALDKLKSEGESNAKDIYDTTNKALEENKQAIYDYADEQLNNALGYNQEAYDKMVTSITDQMEAGKISASEAKELLLLAAEEAKNLTYASAERRRAEAEAAADIARQRAIADANAAYEQNKAEYGAKAEAMGNMGLTGGGYADWLNASAYAQNRAESQAARAQSDAAKREAKYSEDQTKLTADSEYNSKRYGAESEYLAKLYDIDTSYRTNMLEAEQTKLAADQSARETASGLKMNADTAEREGKLENDVSYKGKLYDIESNYTNDVLASNKEAATGKIQSEINYVESIMNNNAALAEYKKSLNDGTVEAEERKLAVYEELLRGVSNGTYTADDAKALANAFGLSDEWKNSISKSAQNYADKIGKEEELVEAEQNRSDYTSILIGASNGTYDEATASALAKEYGLTKDQTTAIINAAKGHKGEKTGDSFVDLLVGASNGSVTKEVAAAIAQRYGLTDEQLAAIEGAADAYNTKIGNEEEKSESQQKTSNFIGLLASANSGELTAEELEQVATELGLNDEQKSLLASAAGRYEDASDEAKSASRSANFVALLDGANSGAYTSTQIEQLAEQFGFDATEDADLINTLKTAAEAYANGESMETLKNDTQYRNGIFVELLNGANSGAYTSTQIEQLAEQFGFDATEDADLINTLKTAADAYKTAQDNAKAEANDEVKKNVYINLLDAANRGGYTETQIENLAKMYELTDDQVSELKTAAQNYATENADAIAKDESTQKSMTFVELLNGANSGAYSEAQIAELAKMFGFSETEDEGLITILKNAAQAYVDGELEYDEQQRSATFVELLNGANSGAYNAEQIAQLASMFGFDINDEEDANLIEMLQNAANAFDSEETANALKNDEQYQNGVYAELLSGVNTGAYTGAQAADLANRFGLDDEAQEALIEAGETYLSNKETEEEETKEGEYVYNKNALKQQVTSDTTDEEIQSWLDDDLIDEDGVNSLKEHRKTVAVKELDKLIKDGDLVYATERADEFLERGVIDPDAYQKTYFDASIVQCENVTSSSDINRVARNLESLKNGGKISEVDCNNALKYLYQISTGIVSSCKYLGDRKFKVGDLEIRDITLEEAKDSESSVLNGAVKTGAMTKYDFAMIDDKVYFQAGDNKWYLVKPDASDSNRTFYTEYIQTLERQSSPTRPKHYSNNTTSGSKNTAPGSEDIRYQRSY